MTDVHDTDLRLGLDLGLSRMRGIVLDGDERVVAERRADTPEHDYPAFVGRAAELVAVLESDAGRSGLSIGVATPGSLSPTRQLMRHSHVACLNDRPLPRDLAAAIGRDIRTARKAGCLVLAEARNGAAQGAKRVFATVVGSGVDGALVADDALVGGPNGTAGAWGHNSLAWPSNAESRAAPKCWCGQAGCVDAWVSGPGMSADHIRRGGHSLAAEEIVTRAEGGERLAGVTLRDWLSRMARGFATVVNIIEPEVIVVGGGLSQIRWLYSEVPKIWGRYCATDQVRTELVAAAHGESAVARGAARLWPLAD